MQYQVMKAPIQRRAPRREKSDQLSCRAHPEEYLRVTVKKTSVHLLKNFALCVRVPLSEQESGQLERAFRPRKRLGFQDPAAHWCCGLVLFSFERLSYFVRSCGFFKKNKSASAATLRAALRLNAAL